MRAVVALPRVGRARHHQRAFAADVFECGARGNGLGETVQVVHVIPATQNNKSVEKGDVYGG